MCDSHFADEKTKLGEIHLSNITGSNSDLVLYPGTFDIFILMFCCSYFDNLCSPNTHIPFTHTQGVVVGQGVDSEALPDLHYMKPDQLSLLERDFPSCVVTRMPAFLPLRPMKRDWPSVPNLRVPALKAL